MNDDRTHDNTQPKAGLAKEKLEKGKPVDKAGYWHATVRLTVLLLVVWFISSYGAGILFRTWLDQFSIGGAPLGFWFAQQGAIYVFVGLIAVYCWAMNRLARKYGVGE